MYEMIRQRKDLIGMIINRYLCQVHDECEGRCFNFVADEFEIYNSGWLIFYNSEFANTEIPSRIPQIKNVIFHDPATIVFWEDGSKTVVKCHDEAFDKEKGLAMAIVKKTMADNKGNYNDIFKRWCK